MSTTTAPPIVRHPKGLEVALWLVQIALALVFFMAGGNKVAGTPAMVRLFDVIGAGQWFRYVTGCIEILGAVFLVLPWMVGTGAVLLGCVMIGALATNMFVLHASPAVPLVLLAALVFVAWGRRAQLVTLVRRGGLT